MNCIFQAVTISHFLQLKPSRPFLILKPKIIFIFKTAPLKGYNSLKWHFPQVCFHVFDVVVWKQRLLMNLLRWPTLKPCNCQKRVSLRHLEHPNPISPLASLLWLRSCSITTQRFIYFTISSGSFKLFCIQIFFCRYIGLAECRQEFYFIILKYSNYTCTINIDRELKGRLHSISQQKLQWQKGVCRVGVKSTAESLEPLTGALSGDWCC